MSVAPANLLTRGQRYAREHGAPDEVLDQFAKLGTERKLSDMAD